MTAMRLATSVVLLATLAGCDEPLPPPSKPTYVDDVEPILQGNCFHCHGADRSAVGAFRWDFFDPGDATLKAIRDFSTEFPLGGAGNAGHGKTLIVTYVKKTGDDRMPPPPATPLSANDILTLDRFYNTGAQPRGMRSFNKKPTATWLVKPTSVVVDDANGEQVLGKVTCAGAETPVLSAGATKLAAGSQPPCTVTLFDGQDAVSLQLK
jgi:hypothetical protein